MMTSKPFDNHIFGRVCSGRFAGQKVKDFAENNGIFIVHLDRVERDTDFVTWKSGDGLKSS